MFTDCQSYYKALTKQRNFNETIFSLEIQYKLNEKNISYQEYCTEYKPINVAYRKISAIPLALFAVLFKTIYHLACAIFLGLRDAIKRKGNSFKANIYKVTCDFQEGAGHFISLFNDKKGTYLIQKSTFNKVCYDVFLKTSLSQQLLTKRILEQPKTPIPPKEPESFIPLITPLTIAPIVSDTELPKTDRLSPFRDMSETEIQELTIAQVKEISPEEVEDIRLRCLSSKRDLDFSQIEKPEDIAYLPIGQICHLTGEELDFCLVNIPMNLRVLLSTNQIKELKQFQRKKFEIETAKQISIHEYIDLQSHYDKLLGLEAVIKKIGVDIFKKWLVTASEETLRKHTLKDLLEYPNSPLKEELDKEPIVVKEEPEPKVAVVPKRSTNLPHHLQLPKHKSTLSDVPEEDDLEDNDC